MFHVTLSDPELIGLVLSNLTNFALLLLLLLLLLSLWLQWRISISLGICLQSITQ